MPRGGDDRLHGERRRRAHDRADIVRIGDLVEHQHHAFERERLDVGRGQGIGLRKQALVHGIGPEPRVDLARAHHLRRDARLDVFLREAPRGILGDEQFADAALPVLQRHGHAVPAIENDRAVAGRLAVAPGRPLPARPSLAEGLAAAPERRF